MPRGDRTGPEGEGPLTGRQAGYCAGNDRPGYGAPGPGYVGRRFVGRGFGARPLGRRGPVGRGFGGRGAASRGGYRWRNWFYATGVPGWACFGPDADVPVPGETPAGEAAALKAQAEWLRGELDAIDRRLQELDE